MNKLTITVLMTGLLVACATTPNSQGPSIGHGLSTAATGFAHLLLSPLQIAAGLLEGITSVPYYLATDIRTLNEGLANAHAKITLDDTYQSVYGKPLAEVSNDGNMGTVFRRMKDASQFFQTVLKQYGVRDSQRYFLTSIDTANDQGYTLFAVIYRLVDSVQVIDKYDRSPRDLTVADRLFYEPFAQDAQGRVLDKVIDWAGLPRESIETQKAQAILITLAANAVVSGKQSPDYWDIEKRWAAGDFRTIVTQRTNYMQGRLGL
ncbi:MAG: hypothetical protein BWK79_04300 [Beggiatoa sp. IS2]|nr:MAG: hypothetical protein BWK79_04300 [Beggiatoa sp. IS2]